MANEICTCKEEACKGRECLLSNRPKWESPWGCSYGSMAERPLDLQWIWVLFLALTLFCSQLPGVLVPEDLTLFWPPRVTHLHVACNTGTNKLKVGEIKKNYVLLWAQLWLATLRWPNLNLSWRLSENLKVCLYSWEYSK